VAVSCGGIPEIELANNSIAVSAVGIGGYWPSRAPLIRSDSVPTAAMEFGAETVMVCCSSMTCA